MVSKHSCIAISVNAETFMYWLIISVHDWFFWFVLVLFLKETILKLIRNWSKKIQAFMMFFFRPNPLKKIKWSMDHGKKMLHMGDRVEQILPMLNWERKCRVHLLGRMNSITWEFPGLCYNINRAWSHMKLWRASLLYCSHTHENVATGLMECLKYDGPALLWVDGHVTVQEGPQLLGPLYPIRSYHLHHRPSKILPRIVRIPVHGYHHNAFTSTIIESCHPLLSSPSGYLIESFLDHGMGC